MKAKLDLSSLLLVITIFTVSMILAISSQHLKDHGEPCSGDCDERKGLLCSLETNTCECMLSKLNSTIYDDTRSLCVTKAGHPCRRIISSTSQSDLCVLHASCPSLNLNCECDPNYFQTRNGTCSPVAKYGEACSGRKPCDKSAGMECVGSKSKQLQCQCKYPRDQYYDSEEKKCISYAGGNCSFTLPCVKNSKCSQDIFEVRRGEAHGKAYFYNATVGKTCSCIAGYAITKARECLPSYQSPCGYNNDGNERTSVCNPEENLKCFDNKICLCQNPLHQLFSKERNKCLNLVGTKCSEVEEEEWDNHCVDGAECGVDGVCKCKTGFSPTGSRECLKGWGRTCTKSFECNVFRGLSCQDGSCNCFDDFLRYSPTQKTCFSGQGSPCGEFLILEDEQDNNGTQIVEVLGNYLHSKGPNKKIMNSTPVTIMCDSDNGLSCRRVDGYMQCV